MKYTLEQIDKLDGRDFEFAIAEILQGNGWRNVEVTQRSHDFGADVIAEHLVNHKVYRYAFQCKRYKNNVGIAAINEALGAAGTHRCDISAVITNSRFTKEALIQAQNNGVKLFDRDDLQKMLDDYDEDVAQHSKNSTLSSSQLSYGKAPNVTRLIDITCPKCNAVMQVNSENTRAKCSYCGNVMLIEKAEYANEDIASKIALDNLHKRIKQQSASQQNKNQGNKSRVENRLTKDQMSALLGAGIFAIAICCAVTLFNQIIGSIISILYAVFALNQCVSKRKINLDYAFTHGALFIMMIIMYCIALFLSSI